LHSIIIITQAYKNIRLIVEKIRNFRFDDAVLQLVIVVGDVFELI